MGLWRRGLYPALSGNPWYWRAFPSAATPRRVAGFRGWGLYGLADPALSGNPLKGSAARGDKDLGG